MNRSISIIKKHLRTTGYKNIQYIPSRRTEFIGSEFYVLCSFLFKNNISIFNSTIFYPFYLHTLKFFNPKLYTLYRAVFRCDTLSRNVLLSVFNKEEIDIFMQDNLLSCVSSCYRFKFRLVPIEDLLIVSSPPENIKLPGYVHVGYDSFSLWKLIKKEFKAEKIQDVLEIGCGAGFLSLWISRFAKSITATDISRNAIDLANLNVKINRIDNITTLTSDVYSNVNGKYDIIISNPPFEFLPSNDKKLLHSYGGQLGIEITMKILSGLEKHLKEQGTTYILANSYIEKSGCNTLIHEIEKLFKGTGFDITMREFTYQLRPDLLGFYKKHDISHSISYLIQIKRTGNFNLKVIPLHGFSRLKENLRLKMLPLSAKT